ncbi:GH25 family lysozyme [Gardnerella greenwoodii]|uniref:GH25 family lysozyme n=1 Tax=Gardnerella greenwoodii TaxID=2914925 RepID=UPI0039F1292F
MALNGIDISVYQRGINIAAVPADFVIVKATESTWYTNPCFHDQADATLNSGKLLGIYHYIGGGNAKAEAQYFVNAVKPYIGRAVLALDFESGSNSAYGDTAYLQQCAQTVYNLTGVRPLLYGGQRDYGRLAAVSKATNCGLWIAQYRDYAHIGYQDKPWNEGAYSCAMRQYSSAGALPNYGGNLDLNKFYGDRNAWGKYAKSDHATPTPAPKPAPKPAVSPTEHDGEIASFNMHIPWGINDRQIMRFVRYGNVVTVNGCGDVKCVGGSWLKAGECVPEGFRPVSLSTIHLSGNGSGSLMVKEDGSIYWDGTWKENFTHVSGVWITKDNQSK